MIKRMAAMILAVTIIFGGIFGYNFFRNGGMDGGSGGFRPPPVTVSAIYAVTASWNPELTSIGSLNARYGVEVSAEKDGIVSDIRFLSGQEVEKGELLLELDDTMEQANLRSFEAQLKLADINFQRDKQLIAKKLVSEDQFDRSKAELDGALARVEQTRANIAKKKVRAPFAGRMGILQVDPGQFIESGTAIASLQSLETLYLDFSAPEKNLPDLVVGQIARFSVDAYPSQTFEGSVAAIDSRIDTNTRQIAVRATVDNAEQQLIPGMFASIKLVLEPAQQLVVLPKTAVSYSLYGEEVYVVEETLEDGVGKVLRVTRKTVRSGRRQRSQMAILEGIEAGQLVVTDGQLKLSNGAEVSLANAPALEAAAAQP